MELISQGLVVQGIDESAITFGCVIIIIVLFAPNAIDSSLTSIEVKGPRYHRHSVVTAPTE